MRTRSWFIGLVLGALSTGCGGGGVGSGDGDGDSDGSTGSGSGSTTGTTGDESATDAGETATAEDTGICGRPWDEGGGLRFCDLFISDCDLWAQDCPSGERCILPGECVPVMPEPGSAGDPCTKPGPYAHDDDCDVGLACWSEAMDSAGTCLPLCGGSMDEPSCAPADTGCSEYFASGWLPLCRPTCDPLLLNCGPSESCERASDADAFVCSPPGIATAALGDECAIGTVHCGVGLTCVGETCLEVCDLDDPQCGLGTCEAHPEPATGHENVGCCAL